MANRRRLQTTNFHDYLGTLSRDTLDRLYQHPAVSIAVFRELPELDKHYVMRTLFTDQAVAEQLTATFCKSSCRVEHQEALRRLEKLRIWQSQHLVGGQRGFVTNKLFQQSLRTAICGGGQAWFSAKQSGAEKHARDIPFLDKYARERWETLLHFLVSSGATSDLSQTTVALLQEAGLMTASQRAGPAPTISSAGFQFLLMETASQVWYLLLHYFRVLERQGHDIVELLTFLISLNFSTFGKDYSTEGLSPAQLNFLQDLREYGLVYQRKHKSKRYYPTRLAISIASGLSQSSQALSTDGFLVVETNYRVYAYTESPLYVGIIALFCEMQYRLPQMSVGILTRESVHEAFKKDITADQILQFMRMHAHPEARKNTPVIPATISDQIRLWQLERDRLHFSDGVLYSQFSTAEDFQVLKNYAADLGVLMWANSSKRFVVVTAAGHKDVRNFWRSRRQD